MTNQSWETPPDFFNRMDKIFGPFDVDVGATLENTKCSRFISPKENALIKNWFGKRIWCNPPYKNVGSWVDKAILESDVLHSTIIMLLLASTDTSWFKTLYDRACIYIVHGRINFENSESGNPRGSIIAKIDPLSDGVNHPTGVQGFIRAKI